jgi:putative PIN family toxin of toxin-antitoxin system
MRAIIDTNILVRAVIRPQGTVGPVLLRPRQGEYTLLYSRATLNELVDVLNRPWFRGKYRLSDGELQTVVALILLRGESVGPAEPLSICRDPKDDKFLELAVAGETDVMVSGDDDLLVLDPFREIRIVPARAFLQMLDETGR